ncbi:MAG: class I tRNA ligase family protein [Patescibacteria group bacterium]
MSFDHQKIEAKWQKFWAENDFYAAKDSSDKEKFYVLVEFPYPSGDGLHVGHCRSYTALDIVARHSRMCGKNVLFPIGFDAFGLPTENFAIKNKIKPRVATEKNIANFTRQLKSLGFSFDWNRVVDTTDPKYFKWTQWIFLKFFEKGLAYQAEIPINWCVDCKIGLANEEVVDGKCERCGGRIERRVKKQWMLAITKYAQKLLDGLETVDFLPRIKAQQQNWIGRSEGAEVDFAITNSAEKMRVFTTRPDTLFGATYTVLAPEAELLQKLKPQITNWSEVEKYISAAAAKSDLERTELSKEKTGVKLSGVAAVNPVNDAEIPIFVADYVLANYGTGAIMAVPAHDQRDWDFAEEMIYQNKMDTSFLKPVVNCLPDGDYIWGIYDKENHFGPMDEKLFSRLSKVLPDYVVIRKKGGPDFFVNKNDSKSIEEVRSILESEGLKGVKFLITGTSLANDNHVLVNWYKGERDIDSVRADFISPFTSDGVSVNSGKFDGLPTVEMKKQIVEFLEKKSVGKAAVNFKLRDWVFSRQRYWGEPIPIVHCAKCGVVPIPEKDLPLELPDVEKYEPTDTGESPLAAIDSWVNCKCPQCGGAAKRETDTMPNWAGSSWYFLRYIDPQNSQQFAAPEKLKYWLPVDLYNGGMEHTVLHLLYSRFWHQFLFDQKLVPTPEPYAKRISHGMILGPDGEKMSKSRGNVVNPDEIVANFGADTLRLYEMFIGPFDQAAAWSTGGVAGVRKFLEKVWRYFETWNMVPNKSEDWDNDEEKRMIHKTIKKVSEDIENRRFNTAVSQLMICLNLVYKYFPDSKLPDEANVVSKKWFEQFLILLAPFAPHLAEELWEKLGHKNSIHLEAWPTFDPNLVKDETITLAVSVNGKLRDTISVPAEISKDDAIAAAKNSEKIQKWLEGKTIRKEIFVPGKMVNFVVG